MHYATLHTHPTVISSDTQKPKINSFAYSTPLTPPPPPNCVYLNQFRSHTPWATTGAHCHWPGARTIYVWNAHARERARVRKGETIENIFAISFVCCMRGYWPTCNRTHKCQTKFDLNNNNKRTLDSRAGACMRCAATTTMRHKSEQIKEMTFFVRSLRVVVASPCCRRCVFFLWIDTHWMRE